MGGGGAGSGGGEWGCRRLSPIDAGWGRAGMGDVRALGQHTAAPLRAVGMTDDRIAAWRRDGVAARARPSVQCLWPPNSERRSRRSGAKSDTRRTRVSRSLRLCVVSRAVSSRISDVASAVFCCGMAGPASTERWRSRRELVALLPQVIAGTLALLRTVICSMSLPTRNESTRRGQSNPIAPSGHSGIGPTGFTFPARRLTITLRIRPISGRVAQSADWWAARSRRRARRLPRVTSRTRQVRSRSRACRRRRARGSAVAHRGA